MKNKKSKIGIIVWVLFFLFLGFVILWGMNKAGFSSTQFFTSIKKELLPFS